MITAPTAGDTAHHLRPTRTSSRDAFTLVELVVVVLILGIIASVVAPRFFDHVDTARESTARQSLRVLRDAISNYQTTTGQLPGDLGTQADLKADLTAFLKRFPKNPLKEKDTVAMQTSGVPMTSTVGGPFGWRYDNVSGQIMLNSNGMSSEGTRFFDW